MFSSPFGKEDKNITIPQDCDIVFVADMFAEEYPGGAELTTEALIETSGNLKVFKIKSEKLTMETLSSGVEKYWIFTNFASMDKELIPTIIANLNYSIVEYDFKYCIYRSPEKHAASTGNPCDCHNEMTGKIVSAFFFGANSIFWMSNRQKEVYFNYFPFLKNKKNILLSSIFSKETLKYIAQLHDKNAEKSESYIIVGSNSWIKGVEDSVAYADKNNLKYEIVANVSHKELLEKMSISKGMIFLPRGGDTCPRTVIEGRLLGCELILNDNVLHKEEEWFASSNIEDVVNWISSGPSRFWKNIFSEIQRQPTISGYTTTHNCILQNYPFEASIRSMLGFCDQVVIVDGGSTDGTVERLREMAELDERILVHVQERDWNTKRFAVFDGLQKALARAICTSEFCWQQDSDEVVHERDYEKVKNLVRKLPKSMDLIALPVLEFWGKKGKLRIDINPWKWRLSRNRPHITHGIPESLRVFDSEGNLYSKPGSDGCDYVRSDTYQPIPFVNFYSDEAHSLRVAALGGNETALEQYKGWMQSIVNNLPSVVHYSWYDIERKINTYKNYWSKHWQSLYDVSQDDTPENNMFFNKSWKDVTSEEISEMAERLESEMGGWIFHSKVDFTRPTPFISVGNEIHPKEIEGWIK